MAPWILKRADVDGGGYVAPPGSARSYVQDALKAQRFPSREAAERAACGNERPLDLGA